jgi:hypothetical protein
MGKWNRFILGILLLSALGVVGFALAETLDASIPWDVVAGGNGLSSGGDVNMHATSGQVTIGETSGGNVALSAGFWQRSSSRDKTYLPVVFINY